MRNRTPNSVVIVVDLVLVVNAICKTFAALENNAIACRHINRFTRLRITASARTEILGSKAPEATEFSSVAAFKILTDHLRNLN